MTLLGSGDARAVAREDVIFDRSSLTDFCDELQAILSDI